LKRVPVLAPVLAPVLSACFALGLNMPAQAAPKPAAQPLEDHAAGFMTLYIGLCMNHLADLEALRARLLAEKAPKLPPESAAHFLGGMAGDAWPVPYQGKLGNYVMALPTGKKLCTLHARQADPATVEKAFLKVVEQAPSPLVAKRGKSTERAGGASGKLRTVSVTWAQPGAARQMQFMVTTAASDKAGRQAMGSVAIVGEAGKR
jgi:hypothetical protein